jgi:NADH dehydrogenase [ubiquinone] 1 alpha subcomplex assembly factor 1
MKAKRPKLNQIAVGAVATILLSLIMTLITDAAGEQSKPGSWRGQSVTEFSAAENDSFAWQIVNDGVMGGLSKGKVEFTNAGVMRFSGTLSLENNGGFSTVRSAGVDFNLSNDAGLLLLVKGDGRTYEARLDSDARFRGNLVSFAGKFETTKGKWQQVKIPFSEFKGGFRGVDLPDKVLDPSLIERVWILLADKREGPFDLEVDWIRTYGKGQGSYTVRKKKAEPVDEAASPEKSRLIATMIADGRFKTLKQALDTAKLTTFFQWDNPLTVFAPTDEAFAKLPKDDLEELLKPENKEKLIEVLSYHVSAGATGVGDALQAKKVKTVRGGTLGIANSEGRVRVNGAQLIDGDVECADGLIHVIDAVLLPADSKLGRKRIAARAN